MAVPLPLSEGIHRGLLPEILRAYAKSARMFHVGVADKFTNSPLATQVRGWGEGHALDLEAAATELERKEARIVELLAANSAEVARRREAEDSAERMRQRLRGGRIAIEELAHLLDAGLLRDDRLDSAVRLLEERVANLDVAQAREKDLDHHAGLVVAAFLELLRTYKALRGKE